MLLMWIGRGRSATRKLRSFLRGRRAHFCRGGTWYRLELAAVVRRPLRVGAAAV